MGGFGYCSGHREDRGMDNAYNVSPGAVVIAATLGQRHLTKREYQGSRNRIATPTIKGEQREDRN